MRRLLAVTLLGAAWASAAPSDAADPKTLVMPGPLAASHADLESKCTSCHRPFDRAAEPGLCLHCHEDVARDRAAGRGFHGRSAGAAGPCRGCHPDHRGRDADITGLDPETFDHALTDFALAGAHAHVACASCHRPDAKGVVKHRAAPTDCASCHRADDAHHGQLGSDCGDCHRPAAWKPARFDHGKTRFPLDGRHAKVACGLCHTQALYREAPTACSGCHAIDDAHRGKLGPDCASCHGTAGWKRARFDHARDTRFPLRKAHAGLACASCHPRPPEQAKLDTACISCHRGDDVHRGRNGSDCARCHDEASFEHTSFRHDRDTKFPLRAAHARLACESCHTRGPFQQKLDTACVSCHGENDPHHGQLGRDCARCHSEQSWTKTAAFDHELTRFPLLGLHAAVSCEDCHTSAAFRDAPTRCVACHAADDTHEKRLGNDCARCHNPNGWGVWRFDHATQTRFALHGAHEDLACRSCHTRPAPRGVKLASTCGSCHGFDDVHHGQFGRDCARCHSDASWQDVKLGR